MDFDFGTLIYIIVTIVAIVAGAMGNKKKPSKGKTGSSGSFFDKLEEQIGGFVDETKESVSSVTDDLGFSDEEREGQAAPEYSWDDESTEAYREEDDSSGIAYSDFQGVYNPEKEKNLDLIQQEAVRATDESDALEVIEMEESSYPDYFEIVSDFDLGTAVVYSTIINRIEY